MSSLRAFRFQKGPRSESDAPQSSEAEDSQDSPVKQAAKRPRMIGDDDDSEEKNGKNGNSSTNGSAGGTEDSSQSSTSAAAAALPLEEEEGMPSSENVEARLDCLQRAFPKKDRMDLMDFLRAAKWDVNDAAKNVKSDGGEGNGDDFVPDEKPKAEKQKGSGWKKPKLKSVKSHHAPEENNSESDSEGEYNGTGVVYDSDDEDEDMNLCDDGHSMTSEQRKVLNFYNEGSDHELATIQGCSKKKVVNIKELRPFIGWGDLVRKMQISKHLSADMLNETTKLLRMRDTVNKLMDKCERITDKMEKIVEDLVTGDNASLELKKQPESITKGFNLTQYQMVGLNWMVLMHKQSLNGILADEMGLGKTIQAIAFLAHLKEMGDEGPHLIIVPSSTMENWRIELGKWCPSLKILNYYGQQDERRSMRLQIVNEEVEFDIILTTYNMVISSADDRVLFRKLDFHYVIFDEAHMLKNMATSRYENLMRVRASRKLLLTGTPLQNNLIELMSLLVFVMPDMFANKKEQLKKMFSLFPRGGDGKTRAERRSKYEADRIAHAKRIMKPFFLRRLKSEVLRDLPQKTEEVIKVAMTPAQEDLYFQLVSDYKERARRIAMGLTKPKGNESGVGLLMNLRKASNHPLLLRNHYDKAGARNLARLLKKNDPGHAKAVEKFIVEDIEALSDFYIHKTCQHYPAIENFSLSNAQLCESGKFEMLDKMLPNMHEADDRVLLFTQFTMVLDVMEVYLKIRGYNYLRLDGSTPVQERQYLIDQFNTDNSIFLFILSTKAGGLGINLTAANTVILHDIDFNPYNDKQAEDRCHRVGQTRPVRVIRFLSADTIEEGIYAIAQDKLQLEKDLTAAGDGDSEKTTTSKKDVKKLLKIALDVDLEDDEQIGDVETVYSDAGDKKVYAAL